MVQVKKDLPGSAEISFEIAKIVAILEKYLHILAGFICSERVFAEFPEKILEFPRKFFNLFVFLNFKGFH